jgi:hypothetical protein
MLGRAEARNQIAGPNAFRPRGLEMVGDPGCAGLSIEGDDVVVRNAVRVAVLLLKLVSALKSFLLLVIASLVGVTEQGLDALLDHLVGRCDLIEPRLWQPHD